jgi:uncharacterized membrane protein
MDLSSILDFIAIVARYVHIVAAIMWIGNSLLFTWMEINFLKKGKENDDSVLGYMNMLHAGGVYYLEKRVIDPQTLPDKIHRFLWQSYTTWISGFILFTSVFYVNGGTLLADPGKVQWSNLTAALVSAGSLLGGWILYDRFWRTPIKNKPMLGAVICFFAILGYALWLDTVFNPRAVYLQIGAMLGTIMTANVFFVIIPNQRKIMAALMEGRPHNLDLGKQAKVRSLMNHYITFPVIFLMLSAHFPQLYSADWNIAIMAVIIVSLVIIKHMMNIYNTFDDWLMVLLGTFTCGAAAVIGLIVMPPVFKDEGNGGGSSAAVVATASGGPTIEGVLSFTGDATKGERLFKANGCQACHLPSPATLAPTLHGIFGKPVELADGSTVTVDEAYVARSILEPNAQVVKGFGPSMPPYGTMLSEEEVGHLIAYVKSLQ